MAKTGRPRVSSQDVLEEAATELFLEQGYAHTSIDNIAARAGVSRATFFNYFSSKADVGLVEIDRALDRFEAALATSPTIEQAIRAIATSLERAHIPLLVSQAETMAAADELSQPLALRMLRLRAIIATRVDQPAWQWAIAGAIAEGAAVWADEAGSEESLDSRIRQQLAGLDELPWGILFGKTP